MGSSFYISICLLLLLATLLCLGESHKTRNVLAAPTLRSRRLDDSYFSASARNVLSSSATTAFETFAIDVDGDGDVDILSASLSDNKIRFFDNDGSQSFTERSIDSALSNAISVHAADVDGDGLVDIVACGHGTSSVVKWYKQTAGSPPTWSASTAYTAPSTRSCRAVWATDLDLDGDIDFLVALEHSASAGAGEVAWLDNDGSENFTYRVIDSDCSGCHHAHFGDIDNDGVIDVAAAAPHGTSIFWYVKRNGL